MPASCNWFNTASAYSDGQEIHALRAQLEAAKLDVIKYCVGTLVSVAAVGIAVLRNWM